MPAGLAKVAANVNIAAAQLAWQVPQSKSKLLLETTQSSLDAALTIAKP
jgi:hypothetical protein